VTEPTIRSQHASFREIFQNPIFPHNQVEAYETDIMRTDVTELQILREHSDYLSQFRLVQESQG
jgi:hypothetical protein